MTDKFRSVFMPPLSTLFINAEDKKGAPLGINEVLSIKNSAVVVIIKKGLEQQIAGECDDHEIDPENCWHDWQILRRRLGRKPDLDPDFNDSFNISYEDLNMQATISHAQKTLHELRDLISTEPEAKAVVKSTLSDHESKTHVWMSLQGMTDTGFRAQVIDLPKEFHDFNIGDTVYIKDSQILDWMVNLDGRVYGAYSLRELRKEMTEEEKCDFDKQMGIQEYINS